MYVDTMQHNYYNLDTWYLRLRCIKKNYRCSTTRHEGTWGRGDIAPTHS
jgi:hypothetical protein